MIVSEHIGAILTVTGVVTGLPIVQFLAPAFGLNALFKLAPPAEPGAFFARHWGLMCGAVGGMLIYAGGHPEVRVVVVAGALLEKAGLVALIALAWREPHTKGMRLTIVFDGACSVIYAIWLLGLA